MSMKFLALIPLLTFLSCGKVEFRNTTESTIGQLRSVTEIVPFSAAEKARLALICQGIAKKTSILSTQLPTSDFFWTVIESDCDGKETTKSVQTFIDTNGLSFFFKSRTSQQIPFPNVETTQIGTMAALCKNVGELNRMPILKGNGEAIYISTTRTQDCPTAINQLCVQIETASLAGEFYRVHTTEWLRFYTNPDVTLPNSRYLGFFTDRKLTTNGFCPEDKTTTSRETLNI